MTAPRNVLEERLAEQLELCLERLTSGHGRDWLYDFNLPDLRDTLNELLETEPSPQRPGFDARITELQAAAAEEGQPLPLNDTFEYAGPDPLYVELASLLSGPVDVVIPDAIPWAKDPMWTTTMTAARRQALEEMKESAVPVRVDPRLRP